LALSSDERLFAEANAALAAGDIAAAEAYLDAILSTNPYHASALKQLASIYRATGRPDQAYLIDHLDPATVAASYVPEGGEMIKYNGETQMIERFATLARLRDAELISPEEYALRRNANLGALLPLTQPPPALDTDQPAPRAANIISRLEAIAQFYMSGALGADAYQVERANILGGLMPLPTTADPAPRTAASVDPELHQIRLERLLAAELISISEFDVESTALLGLFTPAAAPASAMDEQMAARDEAMAPRQTATGDDMAGGDMGAANVRPWDPRSRPGSTSTLPCHARPSGPGATGKTCAKPTTMRSKAWNRASPASTWAPIEESIFSSVPGHWPTWPRPRRCATPWYAAGSTARQ
jgi:hypothetical protein